MIVNILSEPRDEEDMTTQGGLPPGRLREVGDDYITIQTLGEKEGGFANEGAEWIVPIQHITSVIHMVRECAGCAVNEVAKT